MTFCHEIVVKHGWIENALNHSVAYPKIVVNRFKTAVIIKATEDPAASFLMENQDLDPIATNS